MAGPLLWPVLNFFAPSFAMEPIQKPLQEAADGLTLHVQQGERKFPVSCILQLPSTKFPKPRILLMSREKAADPDRQASGRGSRHSQLYSYNFRFLPAPAPSVDVGNSLYPQNYTETLFPGHRALFAARFLGLIRDHRISQRPRLQSFPFESTCCR